MAGLVEELIQKGYLKSERIIKAFVEIKREDFLPEEARQFAQEDVPLPIGNGQTISQPLTVAFMLELLDPEEGQNILDVGSGSGWTTALLSRIVGLKGRVIALEIIPEISEWGKENADKYGFVRKGIAHFHKVQGRRGFPQNAPYDRILVSAMADEVPQELKRQLKIGGKMVIPVENGILYLEKKSEREFHEEYYPGFAFVPLVK